MKINAMAGILATGLCLFVGTSHAQEKAKCRLA